MVKKERCLIAQGLKNRASLLGIVTPRICESDWFASENARQSRVRLLDLLGYGLGIASIQ